MLLFSAIAFVITIIFDAGVEAQGGAYATGVLVLIFSATIAVTLSPCHPVGLATRAAPAGDPLRADQRGYRLHAGGATSSSGPTG